MQGGKKIQNWLKASIREVVFGMEDSLVSTLGAITGIAAGTGDGFVVILSGVVLIFVEALSMTAGSYLSSKSASEVLALQEKQDISRLMQFRAREGAETMQEILRNKRLSSQDTEDILLNFTRERRLFIKEIKEHGLHNSKISTSSPERAALVMGVFYFFGGIFPLAPYFFLEVSEALIPSVLISGVVLLILGAWKGQITGQSIKKSALEMVTISLLAAGLGFAIGRIFSLYFGIYVT